MRKALLLGIIVSVLAISGIGAAFATGLSFTNGVGSLSTGYGAVPQVNVTQLNWGPDSFAPPDTGTTLTRVWLHFDQELNEGTGINVTLYDAGSNPIASTLSNLAADLPAGGTYQSPDFSPPVQISQIYYIRVSVAEGAGP